MPTALLEVEYPKEDRTYRSLTPLEIAEELQRQKLNAPYERGELGAITVATTSFDVATRSELLNKNQGLFLTRVTSAVSSSIDRLGMYCWVGARLVRDESTGKIAVRIHIRV
jgi:hypothetical protein